MAVAVVLVWRRGSWQAVRGPLALFLLQLLLNLGWSLLFFGMRRIDLASYEIIALDLAVAATLGAFWRFSRAASLILVPYLIWIVFASGLCWAIFRLNPSLPGQG